MTPIVFTTPLGNSINTLREYMTTLGVYGHPTNDRITFGVFVDKHQFSICIPKPTIKSMLLKHRL